MNAIDRSDPESYDPFGNGTRIFACRDCGAVWNAGDRHDPDCARRTDADRTPCGDCGRPAEGFASIDRGDGPVRYCHGDTHDDNGMTCYMRASRSQIAGSRFVTDPLLGLAWGKP